jgi:hypothetical protein
MVCSAVLFRNTVVSETAAGRAGAVPRELGNEDNLQWKKLKICFSNFSFLGI